MSLLFIDGFDHYTDILQKYDGTITPMAIRIGQGRFINNAIGTTSSSGGFASKALAPTAGTTYIVGVAFQVDSYVSAGDGQFIRLLDGSGAKLCVIRLFSTGAIACTDLEIPTVTYFTTDSGVITAATYHYIELKITFNGTNSSIELRVNEVVEGSASGIDWTSKDGNLGSAAMHQPFTWDCRFDDLYILDNDGAKNNDYLGDVRVQTIYPSGSGNNSDFTPKSQGTNYLEVNENPPDEDTTLVESGTVLARDLYDYDAAPSGTIYGVQPVPLLQKNDAGRIDARIITYNGSEFNFLEDQITAGWKFMHDVLDVDPFDGADWTTAKVDATEFGIKITQVGSD